MMTLESKLHGLVELLRAQEEALVLDLQLNTLKELILHEMLRDQKNNKSGSIELVIPDHLYRLLEMVSRSDTGWEWLKGRIDELFKSLGLRGTAHNEESDRGGKHTFRVTISYQKLVPDTPAT